MRKASEALEKLFDGVAHTPLRDGILGCVGNTPLIRIASLSAATGCEILGKAEFLNPGGSIKDRAALRIVEEAEAAGLLRPPRGDRKAAALPLASDEKHATNDANAPRSDSKASGASSAEPQPEYTRQTILEGTGGNTGIGLALVAAARGYACHVYAPENCSAEKVAAAQLYGATVTVCPAVPFSNQEHYYHRTSAHHAADPHKSFWGNQFENLANARAHAATTGPEVLAQTGGAVDAVVLAAGTGGTMAGLSLFLKAHAPRPVRAVLVDPPGSSLFAFTTRGGSMASLPGKTIAEGVGINRLTANFASALVDDVISCPDATIVATAHYLRARDGLCIGPSAAMNVAGAVHVARQLGPGSTIVTVLCDGGERYASKLYSPTWLESKGLLDSASPDATRDHADFIPDLTVDPAVLVEPTVAPPVLSAADAAPAVGPTP
jgi:cysteine synthase